MKRLFAVVLGASLGISLIFDSRAQDPERADYQDVFVSGQEGYHTYRIPAIAVTQDGGVLAFAEGRSSRSDHARNDLVMKKSLDNGRTWGPLRVVAQDGANALNNPCVVVLRETGRVLLAFQRYPEGMGERGVSPGLTGDDICRTYIVTSDDHGETWSDWRDITAGVKRPTVVTSTASGPGNSIQLRRGAHAGRILIPFNQGPYGQWRVYAAFSDDGGARWTYGELAANGPDGLGNEVQFVELIDGRIRLNARGQNSDKLRRTALSADAGRTWSTLRSVSALQEPQCSGGFIRFSDPLDGEKSRILYSGPDSQNERIQGAVHLSYDEGETWPVHRQIMPGRFAYSVLARLPDGKVACLFETGGQDPYERIRIARFTIAWLTNGQDSLPSLRDPDGSL